METNDLTQAEYPQFEILAETNEVDQHSELPVAQTTPNDDQIRQTDKWTIR